MTWVIAVVLVLGGCVVLAVVLALIGAPLAEHLLRIRWRPDFRRRKRTGGDGNSGE